MKTQYVHNTVANKRNKMKVISFHSRLYGLFCMYGTGIMFYQFSFNVGRNTQTLSQMEFTYCCCSNISCH